MINIYVPTVCLVVVSWVGFWINREATADRISLGVKACHTSYLVILFKTPLA